MPIYVNSKLKSPNTLGYAVVDMNDLGGHRVVNNITDLFRLNDGILSPSTTNENNDAIGLEWYVANRSLKYTLIDWNKRNSEDGWIESLLLSESNTKHIYVYADTNVPINEQNGSILKPFNSLNLAIEDIQKNKYDLVLVSLKGGDYDYTNGEITFPDNLKKFYLVGLDSVDILSDLTLLFPYKGANVTLSNLNTSNNINIRGVTNALSGSLNIIKLYNINAYNSASTSTITIEGFEPINGGPLFGGTYNKLIIEKCTINNLISRTSSHSNSHILSSNITNYDLVDVAAINYLPYNTTIEFSTILKLLVTAVNDSIIHDFILKNGLVIVAETNTNQIDTITIDYNSYLRTNINDNFTINTLYDNYISYVPLHYSTNGSHDLNRHLEALDKGLASVNKTDTIYLLNNSDTAPATPSTSQDDNNLPSGWSKTPLQVNSNNKSLWVSTRIKDYDTWSDYSTPVIYVKYVTDGKDGLVGPQGPPGLLGTDGVSGNYTSFVFKQSDTQPKTPIGLGVIPSGWVDAPNGEGIWWMSKSTIKGSNNTSLGNWSVPVKVVGEDGTDGKFTVYLFAKNKSKNIIPTTGWSATPPQLNDDEYLWMRMGTIVPPNSLPTEWSTGVRISGEKGPQGSSGDPGPLLQFLGDYNPVVTYTGNTDILNAVRYNNGSGTKYYITLKTAGSFSNIPPTNNSKWKLFDGQFKSIATELLLAEGANIAGWVFRIDNNGDAILLSQNNATVLNGTTGEISASNGANVLNADGSGQLANGNITWTSNGNPVFNGVLQCKDANGNSLDYHPSEGSLKLINNYGDVMGMWSYILPNPSYPHAYDSRLYLYLYDRTSGSSEMMSTTDISSKGIVVNNNPSDSNSRTTSQFFRGNLLQITHGRVVLKNLPTSSNGLPTGTVWRDGDVLKVIV